MKAALFITTLSVCLQAVCLQAQTITHGPIVANVTHSTARVVWLTDARPSSAEVLWGATTEYGSKKTAVRSGSYPYTNSVLLSGLAPGTTYQLRARVNGGTVTSQNISFTTAAEPAVHPEPPVMPAQVDVSMPAGAYGDSSALAINEDCSNIDSVLANLAQLSGSLNYEVVIPAGTTCTGQFRFPVRPNHTGWVVVRSSRVGTQAFPPEGVRWTKEWAGSTARFVTNSAPIRTRAVFTSVPDGSTCYNNGYSEGGYFHNSSLPPNFFPLFRCSDNYGAYTGSQLIDGLSGTTGDVTVTSYGHQLTSGMLVRLPWGNGLVSAGTYLVHSVSPNEFKIWPATVNGSGFVPGVSFTVLEQWRQAPHTEGTTLPASCTVDTWFWDLNAAEYYWCTAPNQWQKMNPANPSTETNVAAIVVPSQAQKYRFIGLEVTGVDVPKPMPYGWDVRGATVNNQGLQLLLVDSAGSDVIWDRCYIHGHPKPARFHKGISLRGDRVAVIESYLEDFQEWRAAGYAQGDSAYGIVHYWGGPTLIRNNWLEVAGITYFAPNTNYNDPEQPQDVTIVRNVFKKRPEWRRTDVQTDIYPERHSWELKQGARMLLEGNFFDFKWSGVNQGATTTVTPRCSSPPPAAAIVSITDGIVTTSSAQHVLPGEVVLLSGTYMDGLWEVSSALSSSQFVLRDAPEGSGSSEGLAYRVAPSRRVSDLAIRSNLYYKGTEFLRIAGSDGDCGSFKLPSTQRVSIENNLVVDFDIRGFWNGGLVDLTGVYGAYGDLGARSVYLLNGELEDVTFRHNTIYGSRGNRPTLIVSTETEGHAVEGFVMDDNIQTFDGGTFHGVRSEGKYGTAALDAMFKRGSVPSWQSQNNVICCGWGSSSNVNSHPPTYSWPVAEAEVGWALPSLKAPFDFRLRDHSQYISGGARRATDGLDTGVDMDLLDSKLGLVKNIRVRAVTADSATISYLAPDGDACVVEVGTSPSWGTGQRQSDGGGERVRDVPVTGLSASTRYHYRVLCTASQPSGTFTTLP